MRVLFLTKYTAAGPSSRYRVLQFLPFLEARGVQSTVHALHDDGYLAARYASRRLAPSYLVGRSLSRLAALAGARRYDLVFIQKEMLPHVIDAPEWWMARAGIRYAVDLDDAIHLMYAGARGWRRALREKIPRVLARASLVLAGNRYLEDYARRFNERVLFFPTVVDTGRFVPRAATPPPAGRPPVVGWMGTPETVRYLAEVRESIESAARVAPLSLFVVGAELPPSGVMGVRCKPWSESEEVADLHAMDVGLMPLADDEWSKGKCSLKLLQYMSAGLASVASPRGSAPEFVREGENALFAATADEWRERVIELAASPALRERMGARARADVVARYSLEAWGPRLADALQWAAGGAREAPSWAREETRHA